MTQKVVVEKGLLEEAAIEAIRSHRRQMASDEVIYAEWQRIYSDANSPASLLENLRTEYLARQSHLLEQQTMLAETLDALGYVPVVPV